MELLEGDRAILFNKRAVQKNGPIYIMRQTDKAMLALLKLVGIRDVNDAGVKHSNELMAT